MEKLLQKGLENFFTAPVKQEVISIVEYVVATTIRDAFGGGFWLMIRSERDGTKNHTAKFLNNINSNNYGVAKSEIAFLLLYS
jgi:hypothetical protein